MLPCICASDSYSCSSSQLRELGRARRARCSGPWRSSADTICTAWAPAITALRASSAGVDAAADGERRPHAAGQDRQPAQAQQQLGGSERCSARHDLERLGVDVGLVEAVEEDEAVGAQPVEPWARCASDE